MGKQFIPEAIDDQETVTFKQERNKIIKAAKDLGYSEECIQELKEAKTKWDLSRIMTIYRKKKKW